MLNNDEHWSSLTRQPDFQKQCDSGGAQSDVSKKKDRADHPFPNKPVIHRRPPKTQVPLGLHDFENIRISSQKRDNFLPKENPSDVTVKTRDLRKTSQRMHCGELEMARAIHAKELILQEKLGKVEKKIRQTIQRDSADSKTGGMFKSKEKRPYSRESKQEKAQKARMPDYEETVEAGRHDNFLIPGSIEDARTEDRTRDTYEVQQAIWEVSKEGPNSMPNTPRVQNANQQLRGKAGGEKCDKEWGKTSEKSSELSKTSLSNTTGAIEKKYKEMQHKNANGSDKQNLRQRSLQEPGNGKTTETERNAERKPFTEPAPPLVSKSSQRRLEQQQAEIAVSLKADGKFQLLSCKICSRKFRSDRLETHTQICEKLKSSRPVYDMYAYRIKGTWLEEFMKTHIRSESPEVAPRRQNHKKRYDLPKGQHLAGK